MSISLGYALAVLWSIDAMRRICNHKLAPAQQGLRGSPWVKDQPIFNLILEQALSALRLALGNCISFSTVSDVFVALSWIEAPKHPEKQYVQRADSLLVAHK